MPASGVNLERRTTWKVGAVAFLAAVLSLFPYPLDIRYWSVYGAAFTETFVDNIAFLHSDLCIQTAYNTLGLLRYFHWLSKPIYQLPLLFIVATVFFKAVEVVILNKILRQFRFGARAALVFAASFLFLPGLDGSAPNGLWGPPDYTKAFLSALLSLGGLYALLRGNSVWAGLLMGSGAYFHIPYGLTALAFVGAGQLANSWVDRKYRDLLRFVVAAAATLIPLIIQVGGIHGPPGTALGMAEWYRYVVRAGLWGNDSLIASSLFSDAFILTVPVSVYFLLRTRDETSTKLDAYLLSGIVLAGLCLLLEGLHTAGIFFGKVSEVFVSIQMRRGLWIPYLVAAIGCFRVIWESVEEATLSWRWTLASWTLLFLVRPTYVIGAMIAVAVGIHIRRKNLSWAWYLCPLAILLALAMRLLFLVRVKAFSFSVVIILLFPLAAGIVAPLLPRIRWKTLPLRVGLVLVLMVGPLVAREIPNWYQDSTWLTRHGWLSRISQMDLTAQLDSREKRKPATIEGSGYSVLLALQRINPQHDLVFYPYSLSILQGHFPGIFAPFWCYNEATHSYAAASMLHAFSETIYGQDIDLYHLFTPRMEEIHYNLTPERIQTLFSEGKMSWFISTRLYPELRLEEQVGEYYIYRKPL